MLSIVGRTKRFNLSLACDLCIAQIHPTPVGDSCNGGDGGKDGGSDRASVADEHPDKIWVDGVEEMAVVEAKDAGPWLSGGYLGSGNTW
jgi:hypothetical protein